MAFIVLTIIGCIGYLDIGAVFTTVVFLEDTRFGGNGGEFEPPLKKTVDYENI